MQIKFREFNPFDSWFWWQFSTTPSAAEKQYVEEVFRSWFFLGKLGGFNAENIQIQETGLDLNYLQYDEDYADQSFMALMHNMGEFEYQGQWGRCWFDLGTSDAIALDVLVNALRQFSKDYVEIEVLCIGGQNNDWSIDQDYSSFNNGDSYN
ncbi:MAG: DUF3531 family protein [Cyanobacteria bacterium WB6_1B_304]|jgi:hypothetical protein|nr:DUF3531 family protein [Cyanobacteria bacterium WB6_1B_304]